MNVKYKGYTIKHSEYFEELLVFDSNGRRILQEDWIYPENALERGKEYIDIRKAHLNPVDNYEIF